MRSCLLVVVAVALVALVARERVWLFVVNGRAGCWPWSPTTVEYREGMTLCPGQTVVLRIKIKVPRDDI